MVKMELHSKYCGFFLISFSAQKQVRQRILTTCGTCSCFYWAGVTTMGQYGPEPGETRVPMGGCSVSAKSVTFVTDLEWKSPQSNGVS